MKMWNIVLVLLCFVSLAYCGVNAPSLGSLVASFTNDDKSKNFQFSWKSCGTASYPSHIDSISVQPDPIKLPGNVSIGFKGQLNVSLNAPLTLEVVMKKKVFVWIHLPCLDGMGSCTYDDVCSIIPKLKCPSVFQQYHIPCKCPIAADSYELPLSPFYIDDSYLPSFLTNGEYQLTAKLSQNERYIACVYMEFSVD